MSKDERIVGYLDSATMAEVDALTDQNDMSKSEYVERAITNQLERDKLGELAETNTTEMKLLRMIDDASDVAAEQLVDEAAPKIAEAVADELAKLADEEQNQRAQQQQQDRDETDDDDGFDSGLV